MFVVYFPEYHLFVVCEAAIRFIYKNFACFFHKKILLFTQETDSTKKI